MDSEEIVKSNRAIRRGHVQRLKNKRRFHFGRDLRNDPVSLAKAVDTPTPCSCAMCCNIRKNKFLKDHDKLTRQEQISRLDDL